MIPTQIVIAVRMEQSVIHDTLRASLITIQMSKAGFVLGTAIVISQGSLNPTSCPILLIRFDSYVSLVLKSALPTLFLTSESAPAKKVGLGENTMESHLTTTTRTSALRKKLTMTRLFFKYLC
jgi:hypothetical protein